MGFSKTSMRTPEIKSPHKSILVQGACYDLKFAHGRFSRPIRTSSWRGTPARSPRMRSRGVYTCTWLCPKTEILLTHLAAPRFDLQPKCPKFQASTPQPWTLILALRKFRAGNMNWRLGLAGGARGELTAEVFGGGGLG